MRGNARSSVKEGGGRGPNDLRKRFRLAVHGSLWLWNLASWPRGGSGRGGDEDGGVNRGSIDGENENEER
jgi:hypothetical protein